MFTVQTPPPRHCPLPLCLLTLLLLLTSLGARASTTFYVANNGNDTNGGTNSASPKQHIQTAINVSVSGDTVIVADGTYTGAGNKDLDFGGRNITVRSTSVDPTRTIIDCQSVGGGFYFHSGETSLAVVNGLTIQNGNTSSQGAGMHNLRSSPTVTNCTFIGNSAGGYGGGMYNESSSPTVTNCIFSGNIANIHNFSIAILPGSGGGMYNMNSSPTVTNCTFSGNRAIATSFSSDGGGMSNVSSSNPIVTNCNFSGNSATYGGGIRNGDGCSPLIITCQFAANGAGFSGGGMANGQASNPIVTNCTFSGNSAGLAGGGMLNWGGYSAGSNPTVTNCTFVGNRAGSYGGGMDNVTASQPILTNCTFTANSGYNGAGINNETGSTGTLTNCILYGDYGSEITTYDSGFAPLVTYSAIQGSYPGVGNINADPRFVSPVRSDPFGVYDYGDQHLQAGSPCIDTGSNAAVTIPPFPSDLNGNPLDLDGGPRIVNGTVDMGAYETRLGIILVTRGGFRYNRATGRFVQTVTLTNTGTTVKGPISLVLDDLSLGVTLYNPTGTTDILAPPAGSPYLNVLPGNMPSYSSLSVTLEFTNPTLATIYYSPRVLTGPGSR